MNKIGLIGVGKMGKPLLNNLLKQGYCVNTLLSPNTEPIDGVTGQTFYSRDINSFVLNSDVILSALPKSSITLNMVSSINNENKKTWIDLCSSCPKDAVKINRILNKQEIDYIDAPVSGGPKGMEDSNITSVVSGPRDVYQDSLDILRLYSSKIVYASEKVGTASMIKLANNTLLALNLVSTSEVMNVLKENDIDMHMALNFINNSSGKSHVSSQRYPDNILNGKHNFGFSYELHRKDILTFFNNSEIYADSMLETLHRIYNDPKNIELNDHTEIVNYWKS